MASPGAVSSSLKQAVQGKSTVQLYRDCLRVVDHMAANSPKGFAMRTLIRGEFRKNAKEEDEEKIEALKMNAARGLANYLLYESGSKDPTIRAKMAKTTEEMIQRAQESAKRDTERRAREASGTQATMEHIALNEPATK